MAVLGRLMPPSAEGGAVVDWERLEREYRIPFPSDFRDFIGLYGAGVVDGYLSISAPDPANPRIDLFRGSQVLVATLRGVRETLPENMCRHPLQSRVGGIIRWAANEDGDLCFWISDSDDPEQWRVGVYSRNFNDWHEYDCGFAEFLVQVLTGALESPFSRSDFPPESPCFTPWRTHLDELLVEGT
ncbi:hypothetical protein CGZ69_35840 [Streptomyces peucetius subsp. caesius ATCC 27952]|nr:hypothetical protein CGZ69_35840 [Streptomyces peucetius subsp. caesius ATCC 27952]